MTGRISELGIFFCASLPCRRISVLNDTAKCGWGGRDAINRICLLRRRTPLDANGLPVRRACTAVRPTKTTYAAPTAEHI